MENLNRLKAVLNEQMVGRAVRQGSCDRVKVVYKYHSA